MGGRVMQTAGAGCGLMSGSLGETGYAGAFHFIL